MPVPLNERKNGRSPVRNAKSLMQRCKSHAKAIKKYDLSIDTGASELDNRAEPKLAARVPKQWAFGTSAIDKECGKL